MPYMSYAGAVTPIVPGVFPAPWSGFCTAVPRIDVPVYMPWLLRQVSQQGGQIQQHIIQRLSEIGADFDLIVNCTGLGARLLTGDEVYPYLPEGFDLPSSLALVPTEYKLMVPFIILIIVLVYKTSMGDNTAGFLQQLVQDPDLVLPDAAVRAPDAAPATH